LSTFRLPTHPAHDSLGLRIADVARVLGVSPRTAYYLRSRGEIPPPDRMLGRLPVWHRRTIDLWLAQGGKP
jgi:predicted DNA-binding transcriptional regulator AlpA